MTLKIGEMKPLENGNDGFKGIIETIDISLSFQLFPNIEARSERAPKYRIYVFGENGNSIPIGAAWEKKFKRNGEKEEDLFLSLTFDDPSFERTLNVASFPPVEGDVWDITWRRRKKRAA